MRTSYLLPALAFGLGLALLTAVPAAAADADPAAIKKLIDQMGNGDFEEREKATAALAELRKALQSSDAEVVMRAARLIRAIELKADSGRLLKPTRVRLVYKDT